MKKKMLTICLVLASLVSGCCSIMCTDEKTISVKSSPSKADFTIRDRKSNTIHQGITPTRVTLKRGNGWFQKANYQITFKKEGYKTNTVPIRQGFETGWYFGGNIVFGGLVGIVIIDPLTGAMWTIEDVHGKLLRK